VVAQVKSSATGPLCIMLSLAKMEEMYWHRSDCYFLSSCSIVSFVLYHRMTSKRTLYDCPVPASGVPPRIEKLLQQNLASANTMEVVVLSVSTGSVTHGRWSYRIDVSDLSDFSCHCECQLPRVALVPCAHVLAWRHQAQKSAVFACALPAVLDLVHPSLRWEGCRALYTALGHLAVPGTGSLVPKLLLPPEWQLSVADAAIQVLHKRQKRKASKANSSNKAAAQIVGYGRHRSNGEIGLLALRGVPVVPRPRLSSDGSLLSSGAPGKRIIPLFFSVLHMNDVFVYQAWNRQVLMILVLTLQSEV
jgi:hypothetical protein